jgi:hypothetical protein
MPLDWQAGLPEQQTDICRRTRAGLMTVWVGTSQSQHTIDSGSCTVGSRRLQRCQRSPSISAWIVCLHRVDEPAYRHDALRYRLQRTWQACTCLAAGASNIRRYMHRHPLGAVPSANCDHMAIGGNAGVCTALLDHGSHLAPSPITWIKALHLKYTSEHISNTRRMSFSSVA